MENEFGILLTGGLTGLFLLAFLIFSFAGQLVSLAIHWHTKKKKKPPFSWKFWWVNNWTRLLLGLLIPLLIAVFFTDLEFILGKVFEKFGAQYKLSTMFGFFVGFFMDFVIIGLRKLAKINPFSK